MSKEVTKHMAGSTVLIRHSPRLASLQIIWTSRTFPQDYCFHSRSFHPSPSYIVTCRVEGSSSSPYRIWCGIAHLTHHPLSRRLLATAIQKTDHLCREADIHQVQSVCTAMRNAQSPSGKTPEGHLSSPAPTRNGIVELKRRESAEEGSREEEAWIMKGRHRRLSCSGRITRCRQSACAESGVEFACTGSEGLAQGVSYDEG